MAIREELIRAIDLALSGHWDAAHTIVQRHEDDHHACRIHAILHRQEGDESNSMYWCRRAGIDGLPDTAVEAQLTELREKILA